jgi:hypothetical protein
VLRDAIAGEEHVRAEREALACTELMEEGVLDYPIDNSLTKHPL